MTTAAPIDLDQGSSECIALVDLENIRISWEREYESWFQYADMALVTQLVEDVMGVGITRIILFATDPIAYRRHAIKSNIARQSPSLKSFDISDASADKVYETLAVDNPVLYKEIQSFQTTIELLQADMQATNKDLEERRKRQIGEEQRRRINEAARRAVESGEVETLTDEEDEVVDPIERANDEECEILTLNDQDAECIVVNEVCDREKRSTNDRISLRGDKSVREIEVRLYDYKRQKGRVIQRGCDVALGAEITKACFNPRIETICLFSADSDFRELMVQNMEAENVGGVYKFAKKSWVVGFSKAFRSVHGIRKQPIGPHETPKSAICKQGTLNYLPIDIAFPAIAKILKTSPVRGALPQPPPAAARSARRVPGTIGGRADLRPGRADFKMRAAPYSNKTSRQKTRRENVVATVAR